MTSLILIYRSFLSCTLRNRFYLGLEIPSNNNRSAHALKNEDETLPLGVKSNLHSVDQSSPAERLLRNSGTDLSHFTSWSEWSVCDRHCMQNRVRRCRSKKNCGTTVLKEERVCEHDGKLRHEKRCKQHQRRRYQQSNKGFHVVQTSKEAEPRRGKRRGKNTKEYQKGRYGKWSKWSPCTRTCTTQRRRWCRKPGGCGHDVIRESAYCYVEGSVCQEWIHQKIHRRREKAREDLDEFEINPNSVDNLVPEENSSNWECGVTDTPKDNKLSYFLRIIGGRPATPRSWPWQVAVLNWRHEAFCGGTLVSRRWILTAAHCVRKFMYVRIGEHDLTVDEGTEIEFKVESIIVHPKYNVDTVDNDVALLRLPVTLTPSPSRGIACLPTSNQALPTRQLCTVIGWGKSHVDDKFGTDVLHEVRVPITPPDICRIVYVDHSISITDNMFCAGYHHGQRDSCSGDSGGPLLCTDPEKPDHPWTIFGITSFGEGCGKEYKYGIYVRLSNYVKWIRRVIEQEERVHLKYMPRGL